MTAPPPPSEAPPPPPPGAPPKVDSTLDLDLDFIAFDKPAPAPTPVAGPSRLASALNGRPGTSFPASLASSRPGTPIDAAGQSRRSSGKGKNKRSNDEVDYAFDGEDGEVEMEMDFDRELDIDPRDTASMRRLRAKGIPWTQGMDWTRCRTVQDMLNDEAVAFWHYIRPTQVEHNVRGYVIDLITACIRRAYNDAQVHVFGSYRTGLYLPYGDIDLVVESPSLSSRSNKNQIHQLAALLRRAGIAHSVQAILGAKVPIVKFRTISGDFAVDISVGQLNGIQSGHIIRDYFRAMPAMQPLVYLVKHFLWQRSLNEVFTGGLGSYATICLVISFLQMHPKIRRNEIDPMRNLGILLMEFFEEYGERFNSERTGISLRDGGTYFDKYSRGWEAKDQYNKDQREKFSIEDPQDPSNDISRGSFSMRKIKGAFTGAFTRLSARCAAAYEEQQNMMARMRNPNDPILMSTPHPWTDHRGQMMHPNITILGCIIGLDDEIISHRHRIGSLHDRGDLQDQLGIPHNAKPSFFHQLGEAAWVAELVTSAPAPTANGRAAPSRGKTNQTAPPSAVSGVRSVTAIMLEDEGEMNGHSPSGSYAVDSDSDSEGETKHSRRGADRRSLSRKERKRQQRDDEREERRRAKKQQRSDDAETSKYAISRPGKSRRGTVEEPLEVSDSDSVAMDIDELESEDEGGAIGPEEYARSRRQEQPRHTPRSHKRSHSPENTIEARGDAVYAKLKSVGMPTSNGISVKGKGKVVERSNPGSIDSRGSTPDSRTERERDRSGHTKRVKANDRAAYWASKGGVPAGTAREVDELEEGELAQAPAMISIKGLAKKKRSKPDHRNKDTGGSGHSKSGSKGSGAEAFADNADFIAL